MSFCMYHDVDTTQLMCKASSGKRMEALCQDLEKAGERENRGAQGTVEVSKMPSFLYVIGWFDLSVVLHPPIVSPFRRDETKAADQITAVLRKTPDYANSYPPYLLPLELQQRVGEDEEEKIRLRRAGLLGLKNVPASKADEAAPPPFLVLVSSFVHHTAFDMPAVIKPLGNFYGYSGTYVCFDVDSRTLKKYQLNALRPIASSSSSS